MAESLGRRELEIRADPLPATVGALREHLARACPELPSEPLRVAVNQVYANDEQTIGPDDELALIPPVSGG